MSVTEVVEAAGIEIACYVSRDPRASSLLGRPVLSSCDSSVGQIMESDGILIAIGDNQIRNRIVRSIRQARDMPPLISVIHPSASVSRTARIGEGCMIHQGAVVAGGARIGDGVIINSGAVVEHEVVLDDFVSLAPGVITGGKVHIGLRSAVGLGAVIRDSLSIGSDTLIGAGSLVLKSLPNGVIAYGSPAEVRGFHRVKSTD